MSGPLSLVVAGLARILCIQRRHSNRAIGRFWYVLRALEIVLRPLEQWDEKADETSPIRSDQLPRPHNAEAVDAHEESAYCEHWRPI